MAHLRINIAETVNIRRILSTLIVLILFEVSKCITDIPKSFLASRILSTEGNATISPSAYSKFPLLQETLPILFLKYCRYILQNNE